MNTRRQARLLMPGLLVVVAAWAFAPAANATPGNDGHGNSDGVATAIAHASPGNGEPVVHPSSHRDAHGAVTATSASAVVSAPATASGSVTVTSLDGTRGLTLGLPTLSGATAVVASSGTVTYADSSRGLELGISVFDSGVQIATVIESPNAGTSFSYPVALPEGARIASIDSGGLVVLAKDGSLLGGFAAPWAQDAHGNPVGTHYEIHGATVVQHVETSSSTAYPVVADPYLWVSLISSASWQYNSGYGWTLRVTPTTWARANAGSYLVGEYDWSELLSKYQDVGRGIHVNLTGMRDQLICHQVVVAIKSPTKATWNIDEWRPSVGYVQTVNAQCNPGGTKIFD